jgi:hypothetical protein
MAQCVSLVQACWRAVTLSRRRLHCILGQEPSRCWAGWIWTDSDISRCIFTTKRSCNTKQRRIYDKSSCNSYSK